MKTLGIDISTKSAGYAIISGNRLITSGKVSFGSGDQRSRMRNAVFSLAKFNTEHTYDILCIEEIPFVNSKAVFGNLSTFYGLSIGLLYKPGCQVILPKPLTWQQFIGNSLLTKKERDAIMSTSPKRSKTWYADQGRKLRKQRTMDWANQNYGIKIIDDDIGDAIAIAHFGNIHGKPI